MTQVHQCQDNSELSSLYRSRGLSLKPISRINVSVHYPELKQSLSSGGKSISSWDIMERIKGLVTPELFISLKVTKNTLEFIRFEGDLENRDVLKKIISRLDGKTMKITGFKEPLKIRAAESKLAFPSKYDWDSYFRDAKNMNEMKAGERPDTIHFQNLPCKWFSEDPISTEKPMPSEKLFRRIWDGFGEIRHVDIPICDPYRAKLSSGIRGINTFTFGNDNLFEAYVQYKDYMSFVKAMDALRGCFLFWQEGPSGRFWVANVKVDFDKSKHLSDESIRKRKAERDKLSEKDMVKKTADKLSKIELKIKEQKQKEKEKKEADKIAAKIEYKIAMEERKYLIARRKLEAIRLMDYLFESVKKKEQAKLEKRQELRTLTKEEKKKYKKITEKYKEIQETQVVQKGVSLRKMHSVIGVASDTKRGNRSRSRSGSRSPSHEDKRARSRSPSHSPSDGRGERRPRSRSGTPPQDMDRDKERRLSENDDRDRDGHNHRQPARYLGDWEVKARSEGGSEVKVSSNYVPIRGRGGGGFRPPYRGGPFIPRGGRPPYGHGPGPGPYRHSYPPHGHPYHPHPSEFEGRGPYMGPMGPPGRGRGGYSDRGGFHDRGGGRGGFRGRGGYPHPHPHPHDSHGHGSNEPIVQHDFSYLDELDRAYEKYFSSITKRHNDPA